MMLLTNFARLAYFAYLSASWNNRITYAANVLVRPLCVMLMFAVTARTALGDDAVTFFVLGSAAYAVPWVIRGGMLDGFQNERESATLAIHFTANGGRLLPFLARGVLHAPNAVAAFGFSLLGAVLFLGFSVAEVNWLSALITLTVMILSVVGLCLFLGTFSIVLRDTIFIGNSAMVFFLTLSGGYIPRNELPEPARAISHVVPMANGIEAFRKAFAGGALNQVSEDLAIEFAVACSLITAGYVMFRMLERWAIKRGSYDLV